VSIEIILHPQRASRDELRQFLVNCRFKQANHLWDWPKHSAHYYWFDDTDYRSFDGVEATVYPPSAEEQQKLGQCEWALHTRTRASASPADKEQQNKVIRAARQNFGGNFYNDWYGKNRYTKVETDSRDATARGIYLAYEVVTQNIKAVRYALPEPSEGFESLVGTKLEVLATSDPTRVLYNALVPFAVAALEHFLANASRSSFVMIYRQESA
jgi:hypothetical protein